MRQPHLQFCSVLDSFHTIRYLIKERRTVDMERPQNPGRSAIGIRRTEQPSPRSQNFLNRILIVESAAPEEANLAALATSVLLPALPTILR